MTVDEIVEYVKDHGFQDSTSADALRWLNNAYFYLADRAIAQGNQVSWLEASATLGSTNGSDTLTGTPTNIARIIGLWVVPLDASVNPYKVPYVERDDYFERKYARANPVEQATATPKFFTMYGDAIVIHPLANGSNTYRLLYLKSPAALALAGSIALPERYHHLLANAALLNAYRQHDDNDQVAALMPMVAQGTKDMLEDLSRKSIAKTDLIGDPNSLGAIRQEIRSHGASDLGDSLIDTYINDALFEAGTRYPWEWLQTGPTTVAVTAGNPVVDIPDNLSKPASIYDDQGQQITRVSGKLFAEYSSDYNGVTDTGNPEYYTIWGYSAPSDSDSVEASGVGPTIRLYPTPDRNMNLKMWYIRVPRRLYNAGDVAEFPREHRRVIVLGALMRAAMATSNKDLQKRYEQFKAEYEDRVTRMTHDLAKTNYDEPDVVRDVDNGWEDDRYYS